MQVRAHVKGLGFSARKARLVVDLVRGKPVDEALAILKFTPTPIAGYVAKVLRSAAANAENNYELNRQDLYVKSISADEGLKVKRMKAGARGRYKPRIKRSSHLTIVLDEREDGGRNNLWGAKYTQLDFA